MYLTHFQLREEPFGVTPDPRFFYRTAQHREAIATLFYAIQQRRGFALLSGQPGVGKTSILYTLTGMLQGRARVAYLANPCYDRTTVLDAILTSFGLEPAASVSASHALFYKFLLSVRQAGETSVAIFDEAQDLSRDTLEAIRLLSNFETPGEKLLQVVLAGQPNIDETLRRPDCEQIRQRLNAVSRIGPLTPAEVSEYMQHRLEVAGGSLELFSPAALHAIAQSSGGVPRNVNTLSFNALSIAFATNRLAVGIEEVNEVCRDLLLPVTAPPVEGQAAPQPFDQVGSSGRANWIALGVATAFAVSAFLRS